MWMVGPAFFSAVSGFVCPSYTTMVMKLTSTVYTPPVVGSIVMQLLPCPYTPPTVV